LSNPDPGFPNENPGALAGATGAGNIEQAFKTKEYRTRAIAATALGRAIADCHPADACTLMESAIADLRPAMPSVPLISAMAEAREWAAWAMASQVKAIALAAFEAMSGPDRRAFLAHVGGRMQ